jgi:hypothetical protein
MAGMLSKYDLQVEAAISDVDRFYDNDLNELMSANIPFVIMMSEHRKEFNTIMKKYTKSLLKETREDLALAPWHAYYAKKIDFNFLGEKIFAYPMIDVFKKNKEVHDLFY